MKLLERLQDAKKGNRDLDRLVLGAIGYIHIPAVKLGLKVYSEKWEKDGAYLNHVPSYTTSIDEALKTIPEEYTEEMSFSRDETGAEADIWRATTPTWCGGFAETIPLAICIAGLKARGMFK